MHCKLIVDQLQEAIIVYWQDGYRMKKKEKKPAEPAAEESAETDLPDVPAPELTTEPPEPDQEPTADAAT